MSKRIATLDEKRFMPHRKCKKAKYDTNWNNMPMEMKAMIMKYMDVITRTRLKMCSKSDKYLVDTFRIIGPNMDASTYQSPGESPRRILHLNVLKVLQYKTKVKVWRFGKEQHETEWDTEAEAVEMIERYFYSILLAKHIRIGHLCVNWKLNDKFIPAGHMLHLKSVSLELGDGKECVKWLKHVAHGVKDIVFGKDHDEDDQMIGEIDGIEVIPCLLQANYLCLPYNNDINDEQLLSLNATHLCLKATHVTFEGIRKLVKKWIDEEYPIGSFLNLRFSQRQEIEEVLEGFTFQRNPSNKKIINIGANKVIEVEMRGLYFIGRIFRK